MMFLNSLKLNFSNWKKTLKFFLYFLVVWGVCFTLILPCFFEFKTLIATNFQARDVRMLGIFADGYGRGLQNVLSCCSESLVDSFQTNAPLASYGLIVAFVFLPFFINIGRYAYLEMLDNYMSSHNEIGFFSALVKSLKKSVPFALCKILHLIVFITIVLFSLYGLSLISNEGFVNYGLIIVALLLLTILFTFNHILVLGWASASIVFGCNVLSAYKKGLKAVCRHFWSIFNTTFLINLVFWAISFMGGVYVFLIMIPIGNCIFCLYDIVAFFTSQGMRFYISDTKIMTPKRLEEVDKISKTAFIL